MEDARKLAQTIARILYDKKAQNITALDVSQMTIITERKSSLRPSPEGR